MSNWKRLGNIAKGMLREAISDSDQENMTEEELLAKLDNIREGREEQNSSQPRPQTRNSVAEDNSVPSEPESPKKSPPTRKPL